MQNGQTVQKQGFGLFFVFQKAYKGTFRGELCSSYKTKDTSFFLFSGIKRGFCRALLQAESLIFCLNIQMSAGRAEQVFNY